LPPGGALPALPGGAGSLQPFADSSELPVESSCPLQAPSMAPIIKIDKMLVTVRMRHSSVTVDRARALVQTCTLPRHTSHGAKWDNFLNRTNLYDMSTKFNFARTDERNPPIVIRLATLVSTGTIAVEALLGVAFIDEPKIERERVLERRR
jgi:hypothetical protein